MEERGTESMRGHRGSVCVHVCACVCMCVHAHVCVCVCVRMTVCARAPRTKQLRTFVLWQALQRSLEDFAGAIGVVPLPQQMLPILHPHLPQPQQHNRPQTSTHTSRTYTASVVRGVGGQHGRGPHLAALTELFGHRLEELQCRLAHATTRRQRPYVHTDKHTHRCICTVV
jgi:hypothetical protein